MEKWVKDVEPWVTDIRIGGLSCVSMQARNESVHMHHDVRVSPWMEVPDWEERCKAAEADNLKIRGEIAALGEMIAGYESKIPWRCPKCRRFTDKTGKCDFCEKKGGA